MTYTITLCRNWGLRKKLIQVKSHSLDIPGFLEVIYADERRELINVSYFSRIIISPEWFRIVLNVANKEAGQQVVVDHGLDNSL